MDELYALAEAILRFSEGGPDVPLVFVYLVVASIPATLLHELGHALAARVLTGGDVRVSVGWTGGKTEIDAARATARDMLLIALAGPAASLVGFALSAMALHTSAPGGVVNDLSWALTWCGIVGVLNLIPLTLSERRGRPAVIKTDGRVALDALRVLRDLS